MAYRGYEEDAWDDEDEAWDGDDDAEPTIDCPHCGSEVHEDAQRCPQCGTYLSEEDAPAAARPWWIVLGVIACLYVVYRWIVW
jgi:hypothetical protein